MAVRYNTFRIFVLRTSLLKSYHTSVPYFSSIFEANSTNVPYTYITKKAYRTSVPYFLAKIKAYRSVLTYRTVLPSLLSTTSNFNSLRNHQPINQRSQFIHLASVSAVFCACIEKVGEVCEKSGSFDLKSAPTYRTRTITKKAYRTSWQKLMRTVPYCHPWFRATWHNIALCSYNKTKNKA